MAIRKIVARSIGVDVIVAEDIAANAITAAEISSGAVTTAKLATDLVVTHGLGSASTPSITFTGDTNTGIFSPTADTIAFAEGGVESMRIDSLGNVGIGTASPANNGSGNTLLDIAAGSAKNANLYLHANNTSGASAGFQIQVASNLETYFWNYSNASTIFATNSTERARIPAAGGIQSATTISVGNATPSTSGAGITFPATQSASSDANTLDDYEEGTFTPSYTSTGISAITYGSGRNGYYTKVGRVVTISVNIMTDSVTSTNGSAFVFISGLPFTSFNVAEGNMTTNIFSSSRFLANATTGGIIGNNSSQVTLYRTVNTTADDPPQTTVSDFKTGAGNVNTLRFTLTYFTA
jgi:hypothetical protein